MPRFVLVTPVHGRPERTRLSLEQRARLLIELAAHGVDARCVVVGDDENLDTAKELGFDVLRRPNELGRKVNDGMEWACREGGADYVAYVGSDEWILAGYLAGLPPERRVRTGSYYAVVPEDGLRLYIVQARGSMGLPPWVIPRGLLEACAFRPADDRRRSGIDHAIAHSLAGGLDVDGLSSREAHVVRRRNSRRLQTVAPRLFEHGDVDELQHVGLRGERQVSPWRHTVRSRRYVVRERAEPFEALASLYPVDLCERAAALYKRGVPA